MNVEDWVASSLEFVQHLWITDRSKFFDSTCPKHNIGIYIRKSKLMEVFIFQWLKFAIKLFCISDNCIIAPQVPISPQYPADCRTRSTYKPALPPQKKQPFPRGPQIPEEGQYMNTLMEHGPAWFIFADKPKLFLVRFQVPGFQKRLQWRFADRSGRLPGLYPKFFPP